jgi:hypothetical protein
MDNNAMPRPKNVTVAVAILCFVLAYSLISGLVSTATHPAPVGFSPILVREVAYTIGIFGVAINAFFVYKIFKGRNWARIIYIVFYVLGVILSIRGLTMFHRSTVLVVLMLVGFVAQAVALMLLFTGNGRAWFQHQGT